MALSAAPQLATMTTSTDLRRLDPAQLATLAQEIRGFLVAKITVTGGTPGHEPGRAFDGFPYPLRVAVMGCVVNGPGEADLGVSAGNGKGQIFIQGKNIATVSESQIVATLLDVALALTSDIQETGVCHDTVRSVAVKIDSLTRTATLTTSRQGAVEAPGEKSWSDSSDLPELRCTTPIGIPTQLGHADKRS